jgi:hypothetical protein
MSRRLVRAALRRKITCKRPLEGSTNLDKHPKGLHRVVGASATLRLAKPSLLEAQLSEFNTRITLYPLYGIASKKRPDVGAATDWFASQAELLGNGSLLRTLKALLASDARLGIESVLPTTTAWLASDADVDEAERFLMTE